MKNFKKITGDIDRLNKALKPPSFAFEKDAEKLNKLFKGPDLNALYGVNFDIEDIGSSSYRKDEIEESYVSRRKKEPALDEVAYWIEYKGGFSPVVLLNGKRVLSKPSGNSENAHVMSYLSGKPNVKITREELSSHAIHDEIKKTNHEIIYGLGFKGALKKIFFLAREDYIIFREKVTYGDLKDIRIAYDPSLLEG